MDAGGIGHFLTEIKGYSHLGEGVGDYRGKPVFIPLAARGEVVHFSIDEEKKKYARGSLVDVVRPGPGRTGAFCPDYGQCGGCQLQHLTYSEQLHFKRQTTVAALQRIGGLEKIPVLDVLPMDDRLHYRHAVRLHAQGGPNETILGNFQIKSHSVHPLTACPLLPAEFPAILADLSMLLHTTHHGPDRSFLVHKPGHTANSAAHERCASDTCERRVHAEHDRKLEITPPMFRHPAAGIQPSLEVVIRQGRATGEILLLLLTDSSDQATARMLWNELRNLHPNLVGIVTRGRGLTAKHRAATVLGQDFYNEIISGIRFHVPATAFFQNNPKQTEVLLQHVRSFCATDSREHLLDLYCGAGLFANYLAGDYGLVTGIEENSTAVAAAGENAVINNRKNTVFLTGRVEKVLVRVARSGPAPDTIILDPPRQGCLPDAITGIAALSPKKIIYVSCNPATLARDLALLAEQHYRVQFVQPIDMFPHTYHIECIVKLEK